MNGFTHLKLRALCIAAVVGGAGAERAYAQEAIGVAAVVRNDVTRGSPSRPAPLNSGDSVVRRETVSTGPDSTARLVFIDQTNLSIGPQARIVLDELVYSGDSSRGRVVVNLAEGAFRFVSGRLQKDAYQVRTPTATIGIRGTEFSLLISRGRTIVTLEGGQIIACARGAPSRCVVLSNPGETAVITATEARRGSPSAGFSFAAAFCTADPSLCAQATFASLASGPASAALCGR